MSSASAKSPAKSPAKAAAKAAPGKRGKTQAKAEPRLSRQRQPEQMATDDWQRALRRQFGREQAFTLENADAEPVFGDWQVHNPQTGGRYRITVRGVVPGTNHCSCGDFASNDLGTCKHIEFTLGRIQARRGGKTALARGFSPPWSEIVLHPGSARSVRSVRWLAGSDCPPALRVQAEALFDGPAGGVLPWDRLDGLAGFIAAARASGHALRVHDEALAFVAQIRDAEQRRTVLDQAYPKGAHDKGLTKLLKTTLYPYQIEGALFAARAGRALLADDMGLGKTVQAIAAAELMAQHLGVLRVLVVCPTSLKHQWQREFKRFSGRTAQVLQGLRPARQQQYQDDSFCKITNYEALVRDGDLIATWAPDLLIIDEAQRVKNWNTIAAREIRRIASPYALVLTGTPLENRLEDLLALVQLVDPHRLGPTWRLRQAHQLTDDHGRVIGYQALDRIGATLAPVLLRRRKAEVLTQLPARIDKTLFVPMTPQQRVMHDDNGALVTRIVSRWRKTGFLSDTDQRRLQCALQNMRMSCNSTWLLDHETDFGSKADELMALLDDLFEQPDAKAVVFSQWRGTHQVILRRLAARGWGHVLFHGGVPGEQRGALIDRFHNDPQCRLFLSTDAGGVGLNLQHAAATVVNMDLPWNPAVLEQRIGRVHRMGQRRGVQVVNFVAQGSIEEGMLSVLAFKKSLFAGVLDGGDSAVFLNGTRLSKFMETVDEVAGAMGQAETPAAAEPEPALMDEAPTPTLTPTPRGSAPPDDAWDDAALPPAQAAQAAHAADAADAQPTPPPPATPPPATPDPWAPLIDTALQWVQALAQAQAAPGAGTGAGTGALLGAAGLVQRDPVTGASCLRLPLPEPATLDRLAQGLAGLLASLRR